MFSHEKFPSTVIFLVTLVWALQDFFTMPSGKRKREDFPSQQHPEGYIPQQDGAGDISDDMKVDLFHSEECIIP